MLMNSKYIYKDNICLFFAQMRKKTDKKIHKLCKFIKHFVKWEDTWENAEDVSQALIEEFNDIQWILLLNFK